LLDHNSAYFLMEDLLFARENVALK
jgi:hypothetical protein